MKKILMLTAICSVCLGVSSVKAEEYQSYQEENGLFDNVDISAGVAGVYGDYDAKGIDSSKKMAWPVLNFDHQKWSFGTTSGLKAKFVNTDNWLVTLGVNYDPGRRNSQLAKSRKGLGEIDEGAMVEGAVKYMFMDGFNVGLEASKTSADGDGVLVTANVGYKTDITDNMKLGFNLSETWADSDYMQEYFGVNATQAAATGFSTYKAESGFKHVSASVSFTYNFYDTWDWNIAGGANFLQDDAKDSPVPKSDTLGFAKTSVVYRF